MNKIKTYAKYVFIPSSYTRVVFRLLSNKIEHLADKTKNIAKSNAKILVESQKTHEEILKLKEDLLYQRKYDSANLDGGLNVYDEYISNFKPSTKKLINKYKISPYQFKQEVKKYILKTESVLDIGVGIKPQNYFKPKVHMLVEPFKQYRDILKPLLPKDVTYIFFKDGALDVLANMDDLSVDSIFMLDLIEHLDKKDGVVLLKEAERVARRQIVVYTPYGFYPMHFNMDGDKDAWGLDGNDLQEHKSGWLPKDFGKGWSFYVCEDCHEPFFEEEKKSGKKYSALMAIKTKSIDQLDLHPKTPDFLIENYKNNA